MIWMMTIVALTGLLIGCGQDYTEDVERAVCDTFPSVADVIVHIEPLDEYQATKTRAEGGSLGASQRE